ncbi:MAG: deoxyribonuclease IV [Desulfurococcales archaeon]|nr:deoxyribonuclease IV [Desulfurococcales archaeon]
MGKLRFGPAGKPLNFKGAMEKVPAYLREIGLDALEYEAVRGVRISEKKARLLGEEAEKNDIVMSMHAPYYINLASLDQGTWERSIKRIVESMIAAEWMGAYAVVIHSGFYKGHHDKRKALERVIEGYKKAQELLPSWVKKPDFSPEIMGKTSQVGDVDEAIEICTALGRCRPTVDWAHLYARYEGKMVTSVDQVIEVIEKIEKELGKRAIDPLHTHFSRIEYGKGGERMHHTLDEEEYGPEWSIVCKAYKETGINAVIISESPILDKDALVMKKACQEE